MRTEIDRVFAVELRNGPPTAAAALEVLFSFEAWDQLRVAQHLPVDDAGVVVRTAALAVLAAASRQS